MPMITKTTKLSQLSPRYRMCLNSFASNTSPIKSIKIDNPETQSKFKIVEGYLKKRWDVSASLSFFWFNMNQQENQQPPQYQARECNVLKPQPKISPKYIKFQNQQQQNTTYNPTSGGSALSPPCKGREAVLDRPSTQVKYIKKTRM